MSDVQNNSGVKRYSVEYFINNGSKKQKEAASKINKDLDEMFDYVQLDKNKLVGTKNEVKTRLENDKKTEDPYQALESSMVYLLGGIDNVFDAIDSDGDGKITLEELNDVAALAKDGSTYVEREFAIEKEGDNSLTAKDLKKLYENVMNSKDAKVETVNDVKILTYGNTTEETAYDEEGNLMSKQIRVKQEDGTEQKEFYAYAYDLNTLYTTIEHKESKTFNVDAPGGKNDFTSIDVCLGDVSISTTETPGRIITTVKENGKTTDRSSHLKATVDREISATKQHTVGNCWVLSDVNALSYSTEGAKVIADAISQDEEGNVTVKLNGVGKTYTFTPEQIGSRDYTDLKKNLSTSADENTTEYDMTALELAINEYRKEQLEIMQANGQNGDGTNRYSDATLNDPSAGGYLGDAIKYLTGKDPTTVFDSEEIKNQLTLKQNNEDGIIMLIQFDETVDSLGELSPGNKKIIDRHAYAVKQVTEDTVYVVNPWDSSQVIAYPKEQLLNNVNKITSFNFTPPKEAES